MRSAVRVFTLALLVFPGTALAWEVGVAPATRKILPATPTPAATGAELEAARNEWEAFQIVIRDAAGVSGVDVTLSELVGPGGARIPASVARLYREHFVDVVSPSPEAVTYHERVAGLYPDPLIPFTDPYDAGRPVGAPFDLAAAETGVVFVDIYVPSGVPHGLYAGGATVTAADGRSTLVPVSLTVWDLDLPRERTIATSFGLYGIRSFHGGPAGDPNAKYPAINDRYYLALHEHRLDPTDFDAPLDFTFDASGALNPIDWTAYDAAVGPWLDGSRFPDGVPVTRFNVGHFRPGDGTGAMTEDQYQQAARAFAEHLQARGWWDRAWIYGIDEPWLSHAEENYAAINHDAALLFAASDLWRDKILITGPYETEIGNVVGIWCPVTPQYCGYWWTWDPKACWDDYTPLLARGVELWFYVCNHNTPPYAGYDIDTAIGYEPRIVKWGTWFERATGFLYWTVNYAPDDDPWNVLLNIPQFTAAAARNGDGILLYPGDHDGTAGGKGSPAWLAIDGPILSYRLKQVRDGMEDWELFRMAAAAGAETFTRAQVGRAYKRFGNFFIENCSDPLMYCPDDQPWTLDEDVLLDARRQVAAKLLHLKDPSRYPDPEGPASPTTCGGCRAGGSPRAGVVLALVALVGLARRRRLARRVR